MILLWAFLLLASATLINAVPCPGNPGNDDPDATRFWMNMIDSTFPEALAKYTGVISNLPKSNATPEEIDELYQATMVYYKEYRGSVHSALAFVGIEAFRHCPNATLAYQTALNSTAKFRVLLTQWEKGMDEISTFEPQVLAQGKPGHWAMHTALDYVTFDSYKVLNGYDPELVKPSPLGDVFAAFRDTSERVRVQYYREGYGKIKWAERQM